MTYTQKYQIEVGYELWKKGYRINRAQFSEERMIEVINMTNALSRTEVTFDQIFALLLKEHPTWFIDEAKEAEEYRATNEPKLRAYYDQHIAGREWDEIDPECWDFYSDWHKDVYGFRPGRRPGIRRTTVCMAIIQEEEYDYPTLDGKGVDFSD